MKIFIIKIENVGGLLVRILGFPCRGPDSFLVRELRFHKLLWHSQKRKRKVEKPFASYLSEFPKCRNGTIRIQ